MTLAAGQGESARRQREQLWRHMGPLLVGWLEDPAVSDILLNADGKLWVQRIGQPRAEQPGTMGASQAESVIATVASILGTIANRDNPILECELPFDGSRFEGILPPITTAPIFTIRRKAIAVFTLAQYVENGVMTSAQRAAIVQGIISRKNILVVGGTGSGKTTLINAIIAEIVAQSPDDRLILIEDTNEIQCTAENYVQLRSNEKYAMQHLLKATLRLLPVRIIVGEVRGPEALTLLKAWNTGHPGGGATVHANNGRAGLVRMEQLVAEAAQGTQKDVIAEAVNMIVVIARLEDGTRRVQEVLECNGVRDGEYQLTDIA